MNIELTNKTALVCGASKGIGKAIAIELANSGANVILAARTLKDLMAVHSLLPDNHKHKYIAVDLQNPENAVNIIKSQLPVADSIDILINNSGGPPTGKLIDGSPKDFLSGFERHLFASQLLVQAFSPAMINRGWGRIINIISISVRQPIENLGVSNTVRGAMASWAKTLAGELGKSGITVNNILPGLTATERLFYLIENTANSTGVSSEAVEKGMKSQIPAGRFAKPEEIGYLASFLASDYASYINGTSIPVDGGYLKCM
ncbi:MAG: SDR family oxidoreductase [Candidatus Kapabacteria bacterium]|nr:SDR family oxidoreductase [Candidatus Kapabacteria bacterium]